MIVIYVVVDAIRGGTINSGVIFAGRRHWLFDRALKTIFRNIESLIN